MKKTNMRRIVALLLAAAMAAGEAVTVFASEAETQTSGTEESGNVITAAVEETKPEKKLSDVSVIPEGVTIGDIDVGGMTGEEADALVRDYVDEMGEKTVDLSIDEETTTVTLKELGLCWENEGEVAELLDTVSRGNLLAQYKAVKDIENGEADTSIRFALEEETAVAALDAILVPLNVEPENATCTRNSDGTWNITEEVDGIIADSEETAALLNAELENWNGKSFELEVPAQVRRAEITSDVYEGMSTSPISSYYTDYWTDNPSRNNNVAIAAQRMNGRMVMPDEVMSVLDMIGPVTAASGYGLAGSYMDGQVKETIGGGICQMATTFYNTAMLLELEIVSRKAHSMAVQYVPYGMDATVFPGSTDLKIRNTTGHALYIEAYVTGHDLYVNFYGVDNRDPKRTVSYRSVTISESEAQVDDQEDTSLRAGTVVWLQPIHKAIVADVYKDVYYDGALQSSEYLRRDSYKAGLAVRRYGPAIDDAGNHYYIDYQGYAVGADGEKYRLNPDGTFLDLPPANQTEEATEGNEPSEEPENPDGGEHEKDTPAAHDSAE